MATGYTYSPLSAAKQEIRILCFDPSKSPRSDGLLECDIEHVSLRTLQRPIYYAISYVWGDVSVRQDIIVAGEHVSVPASSAAVLRAFCRMGGGTPPRLSAAETMAQRTIIPPELVSAVRKCDVVWQTSLEVKRRVTYLHAERRRRSHPIVRLWIDAVCVNQNDVKERGQQVAMMDVVYRKAYEVLIWLGPESQSTERAIASIYRLSHHCRAQTRGLKDINAHMYKYSGSKLRYLYYHQLSDEELPEDIDWGALAEFYDSPWFRRVWVVHEAINARRARCFYGEQTVPLYDMGLAAVWANHRQYDRTGAYLGSTHAGLEQAKQLWEISRDGRSLGKLLHVTTSLSATEPRDMIYSILDLIRFYGINGQLLPHHYYPMFPRRMFRVGRVIASFRPDYSRSKMDTFRMTALALIWYRTDLELLEWLNVLEESSDGPDWPSWVPHFDDMGDMDLIEYWEVQPTDPITQIPLPMTARPDLNLPFKRHFKNLHSKLLSVGGIAIGRISTLSCPIHQEDIDALKLDTSFIHKVKNGAQEDYTDDRCRSGSQCGRGLHCALQKALHGAQSCSVDYGALKKSIPLLLSLGYPKLPSKNNFFPENYRKVEWFVHDEDSQDDQPLHLSFECQLWPKSRVFYTDSGRTGLASSRVEVGDIVCIFFGSKSLHVLREEAGKGQTYRHVGKAQIPGIMRGEYIKQLQGAGTLKSETRIFTLC